MQTTIYGCEGTEANQSYHIDSFKFKLLKIYPVISSKGKKKYSLYKIIDLFLYEESKEIFQVQDD